MTTPYSCTTESRKFSNWALAAMGLRKSSKKAYRKNLVMPMYKGHKLSPSDE
jgi:hypothetical protein